MCDGLYLRQVHCSDVKYFSTPQSPAEPAGVPRCSLPGTLVSIIPSLWLDIFWMFKDSQRCCRDSHSAASLANHVLCLQGYSRFLWTVGGAHFPFSLKIRVCNESHRLFFFFFCFKEDHPEEFYFLPNRSGIWIDNRPFVSNTLHQYVVHV